MRWRALVVAMIVAAGCDDGGVATSGREDANVLVPPDIGWGTDAGDTSVSTSTSPDDTSTSPDDTSTSPDDTSTSPDDTSTSTSPDDTSTSTSPDDTSTSTSTDDTSTSTGDTSTSTSPDDTSTSPDDTSTPPDDTSTPPDDTTVPPPQAPLVTYQPGGDRALYFLNNPEQIVTTDLGDAALGDRTLYRVTATGKARLFFEHVNRTGRAIGFGVQVYNPTAATITVTTRAAGFVASIQGGAPFADALGGAGAAAAVSLAAGKSTWILRKDEAVGVGSFFSGVLDFDVDGGSVIVNAIAYDAFAGLDGSTTDLGYVQRVEPDGTHEARMYKGLASASEAVLDDLAFTVDDATPQGALPVRVARWDLGADDWADPVEVDAWTTHIGPGQNALATTSDMVSFDLPSWGVFDPLAPSDGEGKYPNLGNWGVVYRARVTVTNDGAAARTVTLRIAASPGAGAGLASRSGGGAWTAHHLEKGQTLDLGAVTVPGGASRTLDVDWVLGGPSGGAIEHRVVID